MINWSMKKAGPRFIKIVGLIAAAAVCCLLAWGALGNLLENDADSAPIAYILVGGLWLLLAVGLLVNAVRALLKK